MHIPVLGLDILDHDTVKALKKAAGDAGHQIIAAEKDVLSDLWNEAQTKFPNLIADVRKGIADLNDSTLSGGDKAVKVATDVLTAAPDVIAALPDAKDFLVHGVTLEFAKMKSALVDAAETLLGKL